MTPAPRRTWTCPTKGCGFTTTQPRFVSAVAHTCRLNRDRQTELREVRP